MFSLLFFLNGVRCVTYWRPFGNRWIILINLNGEIVVVVVVVVAVVTNVVVEVGKVGDRQKPHQLGFSVTLFLAPRKVATDDNIGSTKCLLGDIVFQ